MKKSHSLCAVRIFVLLFGFITQVNAALITSSSDLTNETIINFDQFLGSTIHTNGPLQVGELVDEDVVFTAARKPGSIEASGPGLSSSYYGIGSNGTWRSLFEANDGYAFVNREGEYMEFTFNSGPVLAVGGFMNYCPDCRTTELTHISAYGVGGVLLESWNIELLAPIITPDGHNDGAFRGILRDTADIFSFRVSNHLAVIDDLTFSRTSAVPIPAAIWLFGSGLLGLIGIARRKKAA